MVYTKLSSVRGAVACLTETTTCYLVATAASWSDGHVCTDADLLDCDALLVSSQTFYSDLSNGVEMANDGLSFSNCLPRHMVPALMDEELDQSIESSASAASGHSFFSPVTAHASSPGNPGESCNNDPVEALLQTIDFTPVRQRTLN